MKDGSSRFATALDLIDPGASNPCAISGLIREAFMEILDERANPHDCPAIRLMTSQLMACIGIDAMQGFDQFERDLAACKDAIGWEAPSIA